MAKKKKAVVVVTKEKSAPKKAKKAVNSHILGLQLANVHSEYQMDNMGFICVGQARDVYGLPDEDPEVYVWQKTNGTQVTMYDEGNEKCSFVAIVKMSSEPSMANARPKNLSPANFEKELVTV